MEADRASIEITWNNDRIREASISNDASVASSDKDTTEDWKPDRFKYDRDHTVTITCDGRQDVDLSSLSGDENIGDCSDNNGVVNEVGSLPAQVGEVNNNKLKRNKPIVKQRFVTVVRTNYRNAAEDYDSEYSTSSGQESDMGRQGSAKTLIQREKARKENEEKKSRKRGESEFEQQMRWWRNEGLNGGQGREDCLSTAKRDTQLDSRRESNAGCESGTSFVSENQGHGRLLNQADEFLTAKRDVLLDNRQDANDMKTKTSSGNENQRKKQSYRRSSSNMESKLDGRRLLNMHGGHGNNELSDSVRNKNQQKSHSVNNKPPVAPNRRRSAKEMKEKKNWSTTLTKNDNHFSGESNNNIEERRHRSTDSMTLSVESDSNLSVTTSHGSGESLKVSFSPSRSLKRSMSIDCIRHQPGPSNCFVTSLQIDAADPSPGKLNFNHKVHTHQYSSMRGGQHSGTVDNRSKNIRINPNRWKIEPSRGRTGSATVAGKRDSLPLSSPSIQKSREHDNLRTRQATATASSSKCNIEQGRNAGESAAKRTLSSNKWKIEPSPSRSPPPDKPLWSPTEMQQSAPSHHPAPVFFSQKPRSAQIHRGRPRSIASPPSWTKEHQQDSTLESQQMELNLGSEISEDSASEKNAATRTLGRLLNTEKQGYNAAMMSRREQRNDANNAAEDEDEEEERVGELWERRAARVRDDLDNHMLRSGGALRRTISVGGLYNPACEVKPRSSKLHRTISIESTNNRRSIPVQEERWPPSPENLHYQREPRFHDQNRVVGSLQRTISIGGIDNHGWHRRPYGKRYVEHAPQLDQDDGLLRRYIPIDGGYYRPGFRPDSFIDPYGRCRVSFSDRRQSRYPGDYMDEMRDRNPPQREYFREGGNFRHTFSERRGARDSMYTHNDGDDSDRIDGNCGGQLVKKDSTLRRKLKDLQQRLGLTGSGRAKRKDFNRMNSLEPERNGPGYELKNFHSKGSNTSRSSQKLKRQSENMAEIPYVIIDNSIKRSTNDKERNKFQEKHKQRQNNSFSKQSLSQQDSSDEGHSLKCIDIRIDNKINTDENHNVKIEQEVYVDGVPVLGKTSSGWSKQDQSKNGVSSVTYRYDGLSPDCPDVTIKNDIKNMSTSTTENRTLKRKSSKNSKRKQLDQTRDDSTGLKVDSVKRNEVSSHQDRITDIDEFDKLFTDQNNEVPCITTVDINEDVSDKEQSLIDLVTDNAEMTENNVNCEKTSMNMDENTQILENDQIQNCEFDDEETSTKFTEKREQLDDDCLCEEGCACRKCQLRDRIWVFYV